MCAPTVTDPAKEEAFCPHLPFHEAPLAKTDTAWARLWSRALNDPRDVVFVNLSLAITLTLLPAAGLLFYLRDFPLWYFVPYMVIYAMWADRFTLMQHCTVHRPLFNRKFKALNQYIPWVIGPLFGHTPDSFFVHHMGMHHKEGNQMSDLSTTMPFQRDKLSGWLQYWFRFMTRGLFDLARYHHAHGRKKMVTRLLRGELSFMAITAILAAFVSVKASLIVFVFPVLLIRSMMMMGNWGQHAFVDPDEPDNDFKSSITCINTRYNRRCFNDGYHIIHHLKPSLHYSEMADEFDKHREVYGKQDAIVFSGYDFFEVWLLLMLGRKDKLARAFVRLPGAPNRSDEEVIELINRRMRPFNAKSAAAVA